MERPRPAIVTVAALLIAMAMVAAVMSACGDDGSGGATSSAAALTATGATGTDAAAVDAGTYASDVGDLATHADQLNTDYSAMVDDYGAGATDVARVIAAAGDYRVEFNLIVVRLQGMEAPPGLEEAHGQLIAGFGKWVRFYELQAEGLGTGDKALLDQARQLDSQAAGEVNKAIETINGRMDQT